MTDRPIIMARPMVRALLSEIAVPGTGKTQHRVILSRDWSVLGGSWKSRKHDAIWDALRFDEAMSAGHKLRVPWCHPDDEPTPTEECAIYSVYPPWDAGDRAWAREVFAYDDDGIVLYAGQEPFSPDFKPRWRSPIHMPRSLSRFTLLIEGVRVQRLQSISEEDALAEGALTLPVVLGRTRSEIVEAVIANEAPTRKFAEAWERAHGGGSWSANPWVCALTFRPILANIDSLKVAA